MTTKKDVIGIFKKHIKGKTVVFKELLQRGKFIDLPKLRNFIEFI
jgi:hypothetical protein